MKRLYRNSETDFFTVMNVLILRCSFIKKYNHNAVETKKANAQYLTTPTPPPSPARKKIKKKKKHKHTK